MTEDSEVEDQHFSRNNVLDKTQMNKTSIQESGPSLVPDISVTFSVIVDVRYISYVYF